MQRLAFLLMVAMCAVPFAAPWLGIGFLDQLRLIGAGVCVLVLMLGIRVFAKR